MWRGQLVAQVTLQHLAARVTRKLFVHQPHMGRHLERGEILRCGGYLLLRRDLGRFGSQPYRHAGSALALD